MKKKKIKKRKFVRPKAGLKSSGPVNQLSHAGVRFHKNFVYDQLRYTILTITQMSEIDKALVQATLKTINSANEALTLPQIQHLDGNPRNNKTANLQLNGWACTCLDSTGTGRCYVLSYRGIEVALLFKRQLTEVKLQEGDKQPEGVCQDQEEAWMRLDLFGASAKRANLVLTTTLNQLKEENKLLTTRVNTLEELNTRLEHAENKRQNELSKPKRKRRKK
jgi:hypothetical protein